MVDLSVTSSRKQQRHIQLFVDTCQDCQDHIVAVEIGKCAGCKMEVISIHDESSHAQELMSDFDVSIHPTTIIDAEIKVEGVPNFYWQCGGDFYDRLKQDYPLE